MGGEWAGEFDVVVVGSGAAGLTAAVTAAARGRRTLLVEKSRFWGGTTAYSGGGVWIPANPLMQADGAGDSLEEGLRYLDAIIDDVGPASSHERRLAFLEQGPKLVEQLTGLGFRWQRTERYPDYYPQRPGGRIGRSLEGRVVDGRVLGPFLATMRRPAGTAIPVQSRDLDLLVHAGRSPRGALQAARVLARAAAFRGTGRVPLAAGGSLVGQLMAIGRRLAVSVQLGSPLRSLVVEGGRVTGVELERDGRHERVRANLGVVLTAGGFARNDELRRRYQPVGEQWSSASRADQGDAIEAGVAVGAATALMDEAWWGPSFVTEAARTFCLWERSLPGAIIVDRTAKRFVNESASYVDVGRAILDRDRVAPAIPSWLILDGDHRRRYLFGSVPPRITPRALLDSGLLIRAESLEELARRTELDEPVLRETIERFNGYAARGVDEEFGRGGNAYDNYYGDPRVHPNPNLGPIRNPPFWAARLYPGDLGTKGGLLTDERARVLDESGAAIPGLYAAGNTTASVMGRTYPGPGGTLGPAMVFAQLAALDLTSWE